MKVAIHAVGRMKAGPERDLVERYLDRFRKSGPAVGLEFRGVAEIAESRASDVDERRRDEAARLVAGLADNSAAILLDETGRPMGSAEFSMLLARQRDGGTRDLAIMIGGPDGFDRAFLDAAVERVAFGRMTWPHQLVRVMLAEQLYRTTTILSGHPYHRA